MQEAIQKGFKLSMADSKILKEGINAISELIIEANLKIKPQGLELVSMDPANVSMVIFRVNGATFTEYKVSEEQTIGLNISNLKQIFRRLKSDDILSMELKEGRLQIASVGSVAKTFKLPLVELEEKEQKVPELKFPVSVTLPSALLIDAVEDAGIVAESVSFAAEPQKFCMSAQGDLSDANIEILKGENIRIEIEGDGKITSKYSVEYLKKMISGAKLSDTAIIQFGKDYPLKLQFK
ncbi:MAG: proliferating cell nuclear antigen (pcna), partial [Nanoarchaeota archaeon]